MLFPNGTWRNQAGVKMLHRVGMLKEKNRQREKSSHLHSQKEPECLPYPSEGTGPVWVKVLCW